MLDLYAFLTQLMQNLKNGIKYMYKKIRTKKNSSNSTLYMIIYKTIVETMHAIMTMCKDPESFKKSKRYTKSLNIKEI